MLSFVFRNKNKLRICWIRNFGIFEFVIVNFLGCQIKKNGREKEWCCWLALWRCPPKPQNSKTPRRRYDTMGMM
jgi:hypothetical protein